MGSVGSATGSFDVASAGASIDGERHIEAAQRRQPCASSADHHPLASGSQDFESDLCLRPARLAGQRLQFHACLLAFMLPADLHLPAFPPPARCCGLGGSHAGRVAVA
jgi:hypothetical protein